MAKAETATRRNLLIPDTLWTRVVRAAAKEAARSGEAVSASEWIRKAIEERLERQK